MKVPPLPNDIIISIIQMENKRWAREQKILAQHKKHKNKMKPIFYLLNEISNPSLPHEVEAVAKWLVIRDLTRERFLLVEQLALLRGQGVLC